MARLPIDAVFIDCEQGSPDVESVENMARAARLGRLTSLVRVFDHRDWVIERYMGRGVDGSWCRGSRAPSRRRRRRRGALLFPDSHRDKIIVIQIETRRAFEPSTNSLA